MSPRHQHIHSPRHRPRPRLLDRGSILAVLLSGILCLGACTFAVPAGAAPAPAQAARAAATPIATHARPRAHSTRAKAHSTRLVCYTRRTHQVRACLRAVRAPKAARARAARVRAERRRHRHAAVPRRAASTAGRVGTQSPQTEASNAALIASTLATPCQNTMLRPEAGNLDEVQAAALCLVNQERARHNELPLRVNERLEAAAIEHSQEMIAQDYFAHISPSGLTPVERVQAQGYIPSPEDGYTIGENIAWGTLELSTPAAIVNAWIHSPEHLANILESNYTETAMGVAPAAPASLANGQEGAVYSQEFGVVVQ